ncbi:MAG: hypothetical protein R2771_07180 [Saprospiraceae bacterium]
MHRILYLSLIFVVFTFSCKEKNQEIAENNEHYESMDLMDKGIPLKINAPEGTKVKVDVENFYKDITLNDDNGYNIQIIATEAFTDSLYSIKQELISEVEKNPFFNKMISDEANGFIFEKKTNDSTYNYDFRYVKIQDGQQFVFQAGLYGLFTKDQVLKMYDSVKGK